MAGGGSILANYNLWDPMPDISMRFPGLSGAKLLNTCMFHYKAVSLHAIRYMTLHCHDVDSVWYVCIAVCIVCLCLSSDAHATAYIQV